MAFTERLKVRVNCPGGNYVTLVIGSNESYQSLAGRIDAKVGRFMTGGIRKGNLKLQYRDEDNDLVTIRTDEDVRLALVEWFESVRYMYSGGTCEMDLYCVREAL